MTESPLERMCKELVSLAQHYDQIREAINTKRFPEAAHLFDELESRRQQLATAHQAVDWAEVQQSENLTQLILDIQETSKLIKASDDELMGWLKSNQDLLNPDATKPMEASAPNIVARVDAMLPDPWNSEFDVVMIVGEGSAELVKELQRRGQKRLILYLPDDGVESTQAEGVVVVHSLSEVMDVIQMLPGTPPENVITVKTPESSVPKERIIDIATTIEECINQHRSNQATLNALGPMWARNAVHNLAAIAAWPSVARLFDAFNNVPVVVISPGPSLGNNIHLLHKLKGKAVLICVTHALSALQKEGIAPDIVIGLEAQDVSYHLGDYPVEELEALVFAASSHPNMFKLPAKRFFTFTASSHVEKWIYDSLDEEATLNGGGSVSCSGLRLGLRMGANPIILLGQDLSFKEDGQLYVSTNCDGDAKAEFAADGSVAITGFSQKSESVSMIKNAKGGKVSFSKENYLPGFYGGKVRTNTVFTFFHRWFENVAKDMQGKVRLLNCTEGGVFIEGMQHMALSDAIEQYVHQDVDVATVLSNALNEFDNVKRFSQMKIKAQSVCDAMVKSRKQAEACLDLAKRARGNEKLLQKLSNKERKLIETLKPILFLSLVQHGEIMDAVERGAEATNMNEALKASIRLYEVVINAVDAIHDPIRETVQELNRMSQPAT